MLSTWSVARNGSGIRRKGSSGSFPTPAGAAPALGGDQHYPGSQAHALSHRLPHHRRSFPASEEVPMDLITRYARARTQQRGIRSEDLEALLAFGREIPA